MRFHLNGRLRTILILLAVVGLLVGFVVNRWLRGGFAFQPRYARLAYLYLDRADEHRLLSSIYDSYYYYEFHYGQPNPNPVPDPRVARGEAQIPFEVLIERENRLARECELKSWWYDFLARPCRWAAGADWGRDVPGLPISLQPSSRAASGAGYWDLPRGPEYSGRP